MDKALKNCLIALVISAGCANSVHAIKMPAIWGKRAPKVSLLQKTLASAGHLFASMRPYGTSIVNSVNNISLCKAALASAGLIGTGFGFHLAAKCCRDKSKNARGTNKEDTVESRAWNFARRTCIIGRNISFATTVAYAALKGGQYLLNRYHR